MKPIATINEIPLWEKLQQAMDEMRREGFVNADLSDYHWIQLTDINFPYTASESDFDEDGLFNAHREQAFGQTIGMACAQALMCGQHDEAEQLWGDYGQWCAQRDEANFDGVDIFITHSLMMGQADYILPYTQDFLNTVINDNRSLGRENVMSRMRHILSSSILSSPASVEENKGPLINHVIDHWFQQGSIENSERQELAVNLLSDALAKNLQSITSQILEHQELGDGELIQFLYELTDHQVRESSYVRNGGQSYFDHEDIWTILKDKYQLSLEKTIELFPFHQLENVYFSKNDDQPIFELKHLLYADKDRHADHQLNKYRRSRDQMKEMIKMIGIFLPFLMDQFPNDLAPPQLQIFLEEEEFDRTKHQSLWARAQARVLYDQTSDLGHESAPKKPKM